MSEHRKRSAIALLLACLIVAWTPALGAQRPMKSAWLEWANLRVAIAPDSGGTYLWLWSENPPAPTRKTPKAPDTPTKFFQATIDPAATIAWVADVRTFLARPLTAVDSGSVRSSTVLLTTDGGSIYLARRQLKGKWSPERIIIMEMEVGAEPVMVNGNDESIGGILDSLEAVARRTPLFAEVVRRDSLDRANTPRPSKPAVGSPQNRPPSYPQRERSANKEGTVLLSFVVGIDGRADMQSVKIIHSAGSGFLESVLDALPEYTFTPARSFDTPVRTRVVMPFMFSLFRR